MYGLLPGWEKIRSKCLQKGIRFKDMQIWQLINPQICDIFFPPWQNKKQSYLNKL